MRKIALTFAALALFVSPPDLSAAEEGNDTPAAEVTQQVTNSDISANGELKLAKVQVEQRATADDAVTAQFERGSFWWIVAAVVVGGVLLSILL